MTTEITNEDRVVACANDEDCGECGRCGEQQVCVFDDFYCTDPDKPYCNKGVCQSCEVGKMYNTLSNECISCNDNGINEIRGVSEIECNTCSGKFVWNKGWNACVSCGRKLRWMSGFTEEQCFSCPNRIFFKNYCIYCDGTLNADRTSCHYSCPPQSLPNDWGECIRCSEVSSPLGLFYTTSGNAEKAYQYCNQCDDRVLAEGDPRYATGLKCVKKCEEGKIENGNGPECFDCSTEENFYLGASGTKDKPWSRYNIRYQFCLNCSGRIPSFVYSNAFCNKCSSSDETLTSLNEDCISQCKGIRYVSAANKCTLCPERDSDEWNALSAEQQAQCTPDEN